MASNTRIGKALAFGMAMSLIMGTGAQAFEYLGQDSKVKAGSECVRWSGGSPKLNASVLENDHTSSRMYIDCPITRDTRYGQIVSAQVRVWDAHARDSVRCQLVTTYRGGNGSMDAQISPYRYSGYYTVNAVKELDFNGRVYGSQDAHAYFSCRVPAVYNGNRSSVDSFTVYESGP